jgi:hypothetical protein
MHAKATRWTSAKVWGIVRVLDKPPEAVAHAKDVGSVYQLGSFGAARKELKTLTLMP